VREGGDCETTKDSLKHSPSRGGGELGIRVTTGWYIAIFGWLIVLALYLSNAFKRIAELEKRVDEFEGKKK
jgi:hypothetical protein